MYAIRILFSRISNGAFKTSFQNSWASKSVQLFLEHRSITLDGLQKHKIVSMVFVLKMQVVAADAFNRWSAPCTLNVANFWTKVLIP